MIARVILLRFRPGLSSSSRPGCSHTSTWPFRPRFSLFARPLPFIPPLAALGIPESLLVSHAHTRTPSVRLFCLCRPATESQITYPSRSAGDSGCGEGRRTFPNSRPNAKSSTGKLCGETLSAVSSRRREREAEWRPGKKRRTDDVGGDGSLSVSVRAILAIIHGIVCSDVGRRRAGTAATGDEREAGGTGERTT